MCYQSRTDDRRLSAQNIHAANAARSATSVPDKPADKYNVRVSSMFASRRDKIDPNRSILRPVGRLAKKCSSP